MCNENESSPEIESDAQISSPIAPYTCETSEDPKQRNSYPSIQRRL
jgi:hypothetical protein